MRPIWSGMISFGLVNIPIGMYPATDDQDLALHLLHSKDHGRVKNQRVCDVDGEPVDYSDLVKGYEYEKGKYVELTDEELKNVRVEATNRIVIEDFVEYDEIDAKFFEKPYFLLPGKKSEAPYALLREALMQSKKVGIAKIVIRTKEQLAAVRADGPVIMLDTMHFADEMRQIDAPVAPQIGKREMDMALTLINAMTTKFEPEKYKDTYREALMQMIDEKVEGREVVHEEEHTAPTQVIDLMEFLKKSIEQTQPAPAPNKATRPRRKKTTEAA